MNPEKFPQPRLQTNDVVDMKDLLQAEHKILYAEQPFAGPEWHDAPSDQRSDEVD